MLLFYSLDCSEKLLRLFFGHIKLGVVAPLLMLFFLSTNVFSQSDANMVTSLVPAGPYGVGDTFTARIALETATGQLTTGVEARLVYDNALLQVVSATASDGSLLPIPIAGDPTISASGEIYYAAGTFETPVVADFAFLDIVFEVIEEGVSELDFNLGVSNTDVQITGDSVLGTVTGATVVAGIQNTVPVISLADTAALDEGGVLQIPLLINDNDGDELTVVITSVSNEPQKMQTFPNGGNGTQRDPFPQNAEGFFELTNINTTAVNYSADMEFFPTFGDGGGADGDGSGTYTITVSVDDGENTVTKDLVLTVNDTPQLIKTAGTTKIEAESFDNQGPTNTVLNSTSDSKGIGVQVGNVTHIGFTNNGDFATYDLEVETAGTYEFKFLVSKASSTSGIMTINNGPSFIEVAPTGGWQTFNEVLAFVNLESGEQTLRFDWSGDPGFLFNMDYFEITRVTQEDTTIPVITLLGDNPVEVFLNGTYNEPGATALDDVDGDISAAILIDASTVNFNVLGSYQITYNVMDASNNPAMEVIRTVNVLATPDETPPLISLLGEASVDVFVGGTYIDAGAIALDDDGTDLTSEIVFDDSALDLNVPGTYILTYNVTDAANNQANEVTREVNVFPLSEDSAVQVLNADGDIFLFGLVNGMVIDKRSYPGVEFGIVYETGAPLVTTRFVLSGPINETQQEGPSFPQSLFGDFGVNVQGRDFPVGEYTLEVSPLGRPKISIDFEVIDGIPENQRPVIVLNGTEQFNLTVGEVYDELGATANDEEDGSISVEITGAVDVNTVGSYQIFYNARDSQGLFAEQVVRNVTVVEEEKIITFILVDATSNSDLQFLENGTNLTLARDINIRANVALLNVASVRFSLSGTSNRNQTESRAPYALYGDNNGNYNPANLQDGTYSLTATAFSSPGGNGVSLGSATITFTVGDANLLNAIPNRDVEVINLRAFPNPAIDYISLSFSEPVELQEFLLFDVTGRLLKTIKARSVGNGDKYNMDVYDLPIGTYFLRSTSTQGIVFEKQMVIQR